MMEKQWYEIWFDSEYYHLLYTRRDCKEAEVFLNNLIAFLKPSADSRILDLACGRGRHSIELYKKGFDVTGIDLSENNIGFAKKSESEKLLFYIHDMRKSFRMNYYDIVLNLFTSFGYFEKERENTAVIKSAANALKPNGIFVLDFFNAVKEKEKPVKEEIEKYNEIEFRIRKIFESGWVKKQISFSDNGKIFHFEEKVRTFSLKELKNYFSLGGLKILHLFGDYSLHEFDEKKSERLIIIAKK